MSDFSLRLRKNIEVYFAFLVANMLSLIMRIVVDTNIIIDACLGTGAANAVIAACLKGQCIPLSSQI
jgi:hypothetical protein